MKKYVHGYSTRETQRLQEQSGVLEDLLHSGTFYPAGNKVLEAGCGVGGQTIILARRNPEAEFTCIDFSSESLFKAGMLIEENGINNVFFYEADIMNLPFADETFDHLFVCFVLEHLDDPLLALNELKRVLKSGGTITLIEGDHGSCIWHPETAESLKVWECLIRVQSMLGHDPLIGRGLYPLLDETGFTIENVSPRYVYADSANPGLLDGAVNRIIVPMVQTSRETSIKMGLVDEDTWQRGIADLERAAGPPDGTFFYTWFKALAIK